MQSKALCREIVIAVEQSSEGCFNRYEAVVAGFDGFLEVTFRYIEEQGEEIWNKFVERILRLVEWIKAKPKF